MDFPPDQLVLTRTKNLQETLKFIQAIPFESEYQNWHHRITQFLSKKTKQWELFYLQSKHGVIYGFCLISNGKYRLKKWNKKFQSHPQINHFIDLNSSSHFAYFYIHPKNRGQGLGTIALEKIKEQLKQNGKNYLYGFTRYSQIIPLYQRNGAKIIHQETNATEIRTYYYWELKKIRNRQSPESENCLE